MPEYLAKIKGMATRTPKHHFGLDEIYKVNEERRFFADDDIKAHGEAMTALKEIERNLFSPTLNLESLFEIRHVDLSTYAL